MQRRLGTAAFALVLAALAPLAAAGDDASVTAKSVLFQGRDTQATFAESIALFTSGAPGTPATFTLVADHAEITHTHREEACPDTPGFPACFPLDPSRGGSVTYEIDDLVLATTPSQVSPLELAWTADEEAGVRASGPAELLVDEGCSGADCAPFGGDFTEALAGEWYVSQSNWDVTGVGPTAFTILGLNVNLGGEVDGEPFESTYNTGESDRPADPAAGRPYRVHVVDVLEIETDDATFTFTTTSPGAAGRIYGDVVAETSGPTQIMGAMGRFTAGGEEFDAKGENVLVPGGLSVRPVGLSDTLMILMLEDTAAPVVAPPVDDAPIDAAATTMAAGIGGAALGLFTLAWFWPYLKYVATGLMVVPMYSRIGREDVLEHGKREEIFGLIRDVPGIHAHEISSRAVIGWGTTVYHLKLLENHGLIVGKRTGRYKRFFATAGGAARNVDHYAVLRNETTSAIAKHVLAHPGCIQKDLCAALDLAPSLVTWHMNRLEEVDLVKKVREGRTVKYYAGGSWGGLRMDFAPESVTATLVDAGAN